MQRLNIDEVSDNPRNIFLDLLRNKQRLEIYEGRESLVVMSKRDYDNMIEHLHLSRHPHILHKIQNSEDLDFEHHSDIESLKNELDN